MLKTVLVTLVIAASSAIAAENDEDYKAEAAIRECASVVRSQGYPWFNAIYDRRYKIVQTNVQPGDGDHEKANAPFERCLMSQGVFTQFSR
jgi:hypothetical protein